MAIERPVGKANASQNQQCKVVWKINSGKSDEQDETQTHTHTQTNIYKKRQLKASAQRASSALTQFRRDMMMMI